MEKPTYYNAVQALRVGKVLHGPSHGPVAEIVLKEGTTPPSEDAIQVKKAELEAEYDAQEYARNRAVEYPSIVDVTVALAEKAEGSSAMWDKITAERLTVKSKYPKPD